MIYGRTVVVPASGSFVNILRTSLAHRDLVIHVIDVCTHIGFLHRHRIDIDIDIEIEIDIDIDIDIDIVSAWSQPEFGARRWPDL